jgi:four helix bundle protein
MNPQATTTRKTNTYEDLRVWQQAMELVMIVYKETPNLPDTERYGLLTQMRRAAVSVASNIAEGWGRGNSPDFTRFLTMSRGSCFELRCQAQICKKMGVSGNWADIIERTQTVSTMLHGLINERRSRGTRPSHSEAS